MRTLAALIVLGVAASAAAPPVVRKAPDFTVAEPSGKEIQVSSFKGKVVVLTFVHTTCPHCQDASRMFTRLYKELGPRGLQVLGVAFNDNAAILVPAFVQSVGITYPVGASDRNAVLAYLGISDSVMARWVVPQIVVIDKKGNIRAQSPASGDANLTNESYMRDLIETLLKEPAGAASTKKTGSN